MALPQFVYRRGERLQYRRAYPKELWPVTGKAPFAVSLRTADPKEAERARPEAERQYHAKVDAARAELARRSHLTPLTKAAAQTIAAQWFLSLLDTAEDFAGLIHGPDQALRAVEDSEWAEAEARRALAEGELWDKKRLARCLRDQAGFASEPIADDALARLLARAAIAAEQVHARRLRGDYGARPNDPFFASALQVGMQSPAPAPSKEPSGRTIADLEAAFRKVQFPRLTEATQQGYEPVLRLLRDTLGSGTPLSSLSHDEGQQLFETVQGMPANAEKKPALKGLAVPVQVSEAKRLELPTISPKTINDRYMANLSALFRFARDRGWMDRNPVQGLRAREIIGAGDARDPIGPGLAKVFGSAPWDPKDASGGGRPIRYWGPLLGLFHGFRLGEIAGLEVRDISEDAGAPLIIIRAGKRRVKNQNANREAPVHSELIRLGFLEFVRKRRQEAAAVDELLFGGKASARNQWGRSLSDWFAKHVRALELPGRKLTFHSLRHDFRDALREAEVDTELADYLMGHAHAGMGAIYGGKPSLQRLQAAIGKVRYPGLTLP